MHYYWEQTAAIKGTWSKVYLRTTTKSMPLLQPEYGFCQQNGPEHGQVQEWYQNEKMVVVPGWLNSKCCSSRCVGIALH